MTREKAIKELLDVIAELLAGKLSRSRTRTALRIINARHALMTRKERVAECMTQTVVPPLGVRDDVENA